MGQIRGSAADELEEHFTGCRSCLEQTSRLNQSDPLTDDLRATQFQAADDPNLERLTQQIQQEMSLLQTRSESDATLASPQNRSDDLSLCHRQMVAAATDDAIGQLGHYRVLRFLGEGATGIVFHGEDLVLGRSVAIKMLRPSCGATPVHRQRFLRGARAMAGIEHDHVIGIHEVHSDSPIPYLVMPLLEGESLQSKLDREGRIAPEVVMQIARQIASGLSAVHQSGLVHRDIKPDNLWIRASDQRICILDFGLAREVSDPDLTEQSTILGTPRYMAPEQATAQASVDHRSDLFSLGAILYHALTGKFPFPGRTAMECMVSVAKDDVLAPHLYDPEVPHGLSNIVVRLLEKDPARRYQSAEQLSSALECQDQLKPPRKPLLPISVLFGFGVFLLLAIVTVTIKRSDGTTTTVTAELEGDATLDIAIDDTKPEQLEIHSTESISWNDRQAAVWAIDRGGIVDVQTAAVAASDLTTVRQTSDLPEGEFRLIRIYIDGSVTDDQTLSKLTQLAHLRVLHVLGNASLTDKGMQSIGKLRSLQHLRIRCDNPYTCPISDAGVEQLAELDQLKVFRVDAHRFTDRSLQVLSKLPQLEYVGSYVPEVTDQGLEHLKSLQRLMYLHLSDASQITDQGCRYLAECEEVRELSLKDASLTAQCLEPLSRLQWLYTLEIPGTKLDDASVDTLSELSRLKILSLAGCGITSESLRHLVDLPLEVLDVAYNPINDGGISLFNQFPNLYALSLSETKISDEGLKQLRSDRLTVLKLNGTSISDESIDHLMTITTLNQLHVVGTPLSQEGRQQLSKKIPTVFGR
ncbi:Serine/threonine-protein kinase PrkC [Stieleria neptunia]|uniref:non-specific serine/threonine protein kinase n=2 Tax=Stieleria neptunia TaxID=2527979 RepID=A0A518HSL3_9BACT|nr:Serine/threonine-protein kinase PrkC [Stieleria neptunia]